MGNPLCCQPTDAQDEQFYSKTGQPALPGNNIDKNKPFRSGLDTGITDVTLPQAYL